MRIDDAFLAALCAQPPRILGTQLLPLSPVHVLILCAMDNAFLCSGSPTLAALAQGVWVCSRKRADLLPTLFDGGLEKEVRRWARNLGRVDFREELSAFESYLRTYLTSPVTSEPVGPAESPRAPYPYRLVVAAARETKGAIGIDQAWDMPWSLLVCYVLTAQDLAGGKALISDAEAYALEQLKTLEAP